jgi:ubiquinone/menaquinone biosynthesis C-methylase UbiE
MGDRKNSNAERVQFSSDLLDLFSSRLASTHATFFTGHLRSGMAVLDGGCGPGSITLGLGEIVSPGQVIGIDIEPLNIERAKALLAKASGPNVIFKIGDINALEFPDETFDAVFTHGVVEYFKDPVHAFKELYRVLKRGGLLGARHADWGGFLLSSRYKNVQGLFSLFIQLMKKKGGDPFFGRNQFSCLRKAGFARIQQTASYDCWTSSPESTLRISQILAGYVQSDEFTGQVIEYELSDQQRLEKIASAIHKWGGDPDSFAAEAWGEALAWKE